VPVSAKVWLLQNHSICVRLDVRASTDEKADYKYPIVDIE
jgi:hypothetical protein